MKIFNFIKNPTIWMWLIVFYLVILHTAKFIASVGPPVVVALIADVDGSLSFPDILNGFSFYLSESASHLQMSESKLSYLLLYSSVVAIAFIVSSSFLAARRNWARYLVITLISIEITVIISLSVINHSLPNVGTVVIYLTILIFFTKPSVSTTLFRA